VGRDTRRLGGVGNDREILQMDRACGQQTRNADRSGIQNREVDPDGSGATGYASRRAGKSPVQLTGFGEKISKSVSARKWAVEHAPLLAPEVSGKEEFELFESCVAYVAEQFENDPEFQRTVRAGAYELATEPDQVKKVYEVERRDRLLGKASPG